MALLNLFSNRNAPTQNAQDVWEYDKIPERLRVQVFNLIKGALGPTDDYNQLSSAGIYQAIAEGVAHALPLATL